MKTKIIFFLTIILFAGGKKEKHSSYPDRPNILWIIAEDQSSHYGFQEEKFVSTPNVDKMAAQGIVFTNAYTTAPVCSVSRSALITGMYQTSIGAHHHRSSRGTKEIFLPEGIKTIPELFKNAGYYTSNSNWNFKHKGKEDYNFVYSSQALYDGIDWTNRQEGQPFFAQIQLRGGKLRNVSRWKEEMVSGLDSSVLVRAEDVILPPYYPNHSIFRKDWAAYLNSIQFTDIEVGRILKRLKKENLLKNTIIFFLTDHGISQVRGKQFLYDEGTRIPFIIFAPEMFEPQIRKELISSFDVAATSLQLAGIKIPDYMDGKSLFGKRYIPREFIVCARDRCDETVDHIRSIRKGNLKYIKNYMPERAYLQPNAYKDHKPWMPVLWELKEKGKLNKFQKLITTRTKPEEELYDLSTDPYEINNLATEEDYCETLVEMRKILKNWENRTGDKGKVPESERMYSSDMKFYIESLLKAGDTVQAGIVKNNIRLMKKGLKKENSYE